jgi:hypothetical protein
MRRLRNQAAQAKDARKIAWLEFLLFDIASGDPLRLDEAARQPIGQSLLVKSLKLRRLNRELEAAKKR